MSRMSYEDEIEDDDFEYDDGSDDDIEMTQEDFDDGEEDSQINVVPEHQKPKGYDIDYSSLSADQIRASLKDDVEHVVSIFGVEQDIAHILLRHFTWNKDRLIDRYMENQTKINQDAGLEPKPVSAPPPPPPPAELSKTQSALGRLTRVTRKAAGKQPSPPPAATAVASAEDEPFTCPICCIEPESTRSYTCGHTYCSDCWTMYVQSKIREEGECNMRCMETDCTLILTNSFIRESVDDDTWRRFEELIVRNYVSGMAHLKFCPFPNCSYTISCPAASLKSSLTSQVPSVTCPQGHTFCFGCNIDNDHRPVICVVARKWLKKCQDDSETANWIKTNTKECTKCQSTIEKNGGCNHMTCKKCKHEFCWVCMGPWSEHGTQWYSCNRFDEQSAVDARDAQSKSRISLERYLHYYNRWANHEQSARLSADLYLKTEKKMEEIQLTTELTWIEVQFLKQALDEVLRCRMTLKWTYAMAYYLEKSNYKEMFEDNQRDLEKAVEDLSELMESGIEPETIPVLRQKITDKTVYVHKRNEIVLEDTANGFREERWEWNVPVEV